MNKMYRRRAKVPWHTILQPQVVGNEILALETPILLEKEEKESSPQKNNSKYVSFVKIPNARTGNILFQYLFAITISLRFGHKYIAIEEFPNPMDLTIKIKEESSASYEKDDSTMASNIICEGFFQQSSYYVPIREELLAYLASTEDYWIGFNGTREYARDFLFGNYSHTIGPKDIVMSLRLDDFIQLPKPKSDILPPRFYTDIIEKWFSTEGREDGRLIIVCDKLRHPWEHKYLEFFQKWSPTLIQGSLMEDFALMRDCPALIHSNSTLCWMASFLSKTKTNRFIPITNTYASQQLDIIESLKDVVASVDTLEHEQVYRINIMCDHRDIESLPYSIPDEIIVDLEPTNKQHVVSPLVPGDSSDYVFGLGQEQDYYNMYKTSRFALTQKKGGWDCLRHYEILANGAIPIFEGIEHCPADTLTSFPKTLLSNATKDLLPWFGTEEQHELYEEHRMKLLRHVREHCSSTAVAANFLRSMHCRAFPKILMLTGHPGVNYTRELTWIGIKRLADIAVEWPSMDYLYTSFDSNTKIYGNGFTYSRRLPDSLNIRLTEEEVVRSISEKRWDIIIYGKVGPDEGQEGSLPNLPLWKHVFKRYSRDEIVFWYGGDGMQDMTWENRYSTHLVQHCQYAHCFVRELIRWNGKF